MSALKEATADLHHGAEAHPFGQRMAAGNVTSQEWADWCDALLTLHAEIDPHLPRPCWRVAALAKDLAELPTPRPSLAAETFAATLSTRQARHGAAYILLGAALRGGAVIRKRIGGRLPTAHLHFDKDAAATDAVLNILGRDETLIEGARACFAALIAVMDEVEEHANG